MYSSPFIILLCNLLQVKNVPVLEQNIEHFVEQTSSRFIKKFDCNNQEEHKTILQKYPQIISTWIVHEVQYLHVQKTSCQVFEIEGEGSHILYIIDGKLKELFWFLPPLKTELPPFSYDIQTQELENLENLLDFCTQTRKKILSDHSLLIEGFQCTTVSANTTNVDPYINHNSVKQRVKDSIFSKSQVQIYFEPLEKNLVQGHILFQ